MKDIKNLTEKIFEIARTIILVLDTEGKIVDFNPYMEEISGYKLEEVKGKDWFSTALLEEDLEEIKKVFKKALGETKTNGYINPIITKSGEKKLIEWYDSTLRNEVGEIVGLVALGQDVTMREQLEDELRKKMKKITELEEANKRRYAKMMQQQMEIIELKKDIENRN